WPLWHDGSTPLPRSLLVIAGIGLALIPGLPRIELAPELVLLGILPPLIYSAGVTMSWREFRFNLRPITLLAVGCRVLERAAAHSGRYAAARNLLLGSARLFARRTGLPRDRLADSNGARSAGSDLVARPVARSAADRRDRHRCPVCLGLSGGLFAASAEPRA